MQVLLRGAGVLTFRSAEDQMDRSANQKDVARAAGVSVSTVSRALSNQPGISDDVRAKISKLAQELGYRARGDAGQTARFIRTYVTGNAVTGGLVPFYNAIVEGLNAAAMTAGLILEIRLIQDRVLDPRRFDRDAEEATAAGTMLVGIDPSPEIAARLKAQKTVVLVNTFDPEMRFDCVGPNNFYGGALATNMLIGAGHRSLLHVRDHLRPTTVQRHLGFQSAVATAVGARGIVFDAPDAAEAAMRDMVRERKAQHTDWTGVYCVHDLAAIRLIHALEAEGFRVPQDVSVVGFDDLPAASMMSPRLSTVRVDCQAIGAQAIALMLRRLSYPEAGSVQAECGVSAVAGGTIAQFAEN
jgi:DNA-binding LacI/PurR family transcriptional regulator